MLKAPPPNVTAAVAAKPAYGLTSGGLTIRESFQPTLMEFSELLDRSKAQKQDLNMKIPLPSDWKLSTIEKQLCVTVDKISALRFRLAYGYISSIKVTDSFDTGSPFCAQVILRLPYRFGVTAHETQNSWVFCRVNAFASCACLPSSAQAVRVGMPVCGLVAKSSKTYETAQLAGWSTTTAEDWKLLSRDTFSFMGLELSIQDVYRLPALRQKYFPYPAQPPSFGLHLSFASRQLTCGYGSPH